MQKYVEFREDLTGSLRNRVVPLTDLGKYINTWKDCYRSVFYFDETILKHVADTGSVKRYPGKAGIDRIVWDFDRTDSLEEARKEAVELVSRLINSYGVKESEIGVAFSGKKGFGIELKVEGIPYFDNLFDENVPAYIKHLCLEVAKDLTIDTSIYSKIFLYRIIGTLHNKESDLNGHSVQLFKTSLPMQLFREGTIDDIKTYSLGIKLPEPLVAVSDSSKLSESLDNIIKNYDKIIRELPTHAALNDGELPNEDDAPKGSKICIWRLCQGSYTEGRDNALLRIADHEKKSGMPPEVVRAKLTGVLELMNRTDPQKAATDPITDEDLDRLVTQVFTGNYDFGCYDSVLDSQCSKKCYLAPKKFKDSVLGTITLGEAYQKARSFFEKYYENIALTGIKTIDDQMPLFLGTSNLIVGKPGVGKTSLMLNIVKNSIKQGMPTLFFSLDMDEKLLIQRFAPILLSDDGKPLMSGKEFMQAHARGDKELVERSKKAFEKASEDVLISSKRGTTVKMIEEEIEKQEAIWGKKAKIVIIDYVQLLTSEKEGFANHTYNAESLTELAKNKNVCIIGLSQAMGNHGDGDLLAKGSRAWEEQASTQANCFRPFRQMPEYDWIITVAMAKNRLGPSEKVELYFHGPSGVVRDLTKEEDEILVALKDRLEYDEQQ